MFGNGVPLVTYLTCQMPGMTCAPLLPVSRCHLFIAFTIPLGRLFPLGYFCFGAQMKNYHPPLYSLFPFASLQ